MICNDETASRSWLRRARPRSRGAGRAEPSADRLARIAAPAVGCSILLASACSDAPGPGGDGAAGDVGSPDIALAAVVEPAYVVGAGTGEDWELFGNVPSVSFDDAGNLHVFDAGAQRVVVVGPDGSLARIVGRPGEGPGELQGASAMAVLPGGRIAIFEFGLPGRFEIVDADGTFAETVSFDITKGAPAPKVLPLPDGRLISTGGPRVTLPGAEPDGGSVPAGRRAMEIFPLDGSDPRVFYHAWGLAPPRGDSIVVQLEADMTMSLPPSRGLEPGLHWAVLRDGRVAVADSIGYRVKLVTPEGEDAAWIERPVPPLTVTAAVREAVRAHARADLEAAASLDVLAGVEMGMPPAMREATERRIEEMIFPDDIPVIAGLAVDWDGRLWIARWGADGVVDGPIDIVEPSGRYVGTLPLDGPRIPDAFGPGGQMAYLEEDEMGVQTVRVARLVSLGR